MVGPQGHAAAFALVQFTTNSFPVSPHSPAPRAIILLASESSAYLCNSLGRRNRTYVDVHGRIGTGARRSDAGGVCTCRQSMMAQHLNRSLPEGETRTTPQTALDGLRIVDVGCGGGILAEVNFEDSAACWAMRRSLAGPPPAEHLHLCGEYICQVAQPERLDFGRSENPTSTGLSF